MTGPARTYYEACQGQWRAPIGMTVAFRGVRGSMTGSGSVDPTATRAEYTLTFLGVEIRQRTLREADRVTVDQEGPGFVAHHELLRQA